VRIFLDTNILLDVVEQRDPFFAASKEVLERCDARGWDLLVASHGLATLFYLTARKSGKSAALDAIEQILAWAEAAPLGDAEARAALSYGITDYEDALQVSAAVAGGADWFITRDPAGFTASPISVLSPEEFLTRF